MDQHQNVLKEKKAKLLENLQNSKIIAVVGVCKNAGKTTFLNWFLQNISNSAVFTTGRDGEEYDLVGGHKKPKVLLPANFFYTCFDYEIKKQSPFIQVIDKTNFKAASKNLWVVKSSKNLKAEIVGPASAFNQIQLAKKLLSLSSEKVIIDGSLDRKSVVLHPEVDSCILVAGADFGNEKQLELELKRQIALSQVKKFEGTFDFIDEVAIVKNKKLTNLGFKQLYKNEGILLEKAYDADYVFIPGAITDLSFHKLGNFIKNNNCKFIFKHPVSIQTSNYAWLNKALCLTTYKLNGIALNGYSTKGKHLNLTNLQNKLNNTFTNIPVIDVYGV